MSIDYDAFLSWAESRFDNVKTNGREIMVNSPFADDNKNHLWCNVDGGKNGREDGVFRCWKSDKRGTLVGLVMKVDGLPYEEAVYQIRGETEMSKVYSDLDDFFNANKKSDKKPAKIEIDPEKPPHMRLPPFTYPLSQLTQHYKGSEAIAYLESRKIDYEKFNIEFCTQDKYRNRIIIPYYDKDGNLIYWNGRHLSDSAKPKYLGPEEEVYGVGKRDVLFFTYWPNDGWVFLTEGELDSISLTIACGRASVACGGKTLTPKQLEMLRGFNVCIALDNDSAGKSALKVIGDSLNSNGIEVRQVSPPEGFKDWNAMLQVINPETIKQYINKTTVPFTKWPNPR